SSLHVLFPCPADLALLKEHGLLERHNIQFHWKNQSYTDMAQFLKHMTQRHRKRIRQSRRHLQTQDITCDWHEGRNISDDVLDFFYRCYCQTYMEHGNAPYLSRDFFFQLREQLSQHIVIVMASQNQQPIASAFF